MAFSIYSSILGLKSLQSKGWVHSCIYLKEEQSDAKSGCPDQSCNIVFVILFIILNIHGPNSVPIFTGMIKKKTVKDTSPLIPMSMCGAFKSQIQGKKSLKRLKSRLCYVRNLALCAADRGRRGWIFTDDKISFGGRESLEHRDATRREGEQRHIVSFSFIRSCAV